MCRLEQSERRDSAIVVMRFNASATRIRECSHRRHGPLVPVSADATGQKGPLCSRYVGRRTP